MDNHAVDGLPCDDGASCTLADDCQIGLCGGTPDPAPCQNPWFCDGPEVCEPDNANADPNTGCAPGTPPNCADPVDCTTDFCDESQDRCRRIADDSACENDGLYCNGEPKCDLVTGCSNVNVPSCINGVCDEDLNACVGAGDGNSDCRVNNNCGPNTVCNAETGQCDGVASGDCRAANNCAPGTTCNANTGACDPNPPSCTAAVNPVVCVGGTVCNVNTGACDPAITCGEGTVLVNGECVDEGTSCVENEAICPAGTTCNAGTGLCAQKGFTCNRDVNGVLIRGEGGLILCWQDSKGFNCYDTDMDAGPNNYVRCVGLVVVPGGEWSTILDADDADPMVFPGAQETCDGKDNDQDGLGDVAEGLTCDEVCDGRDNNGDGKLDNGVPSNVGGQDLCRPSGVQACGQWAIPAAGSPDEWPVLFFTTLAAAVADGCASNAPYPVSLSCNAGDYVLRGDDANREATTGIAAANFDAERAYRCQPTQFPHTCTPLDAVANEGGWFCYE